MQLGERVFVLLNPGGRIGSLCRQGSRSDGALVKIWGQVVHQVCLFIQSETDASSKKYSDFHPTCSLAKILIAVGNNAGVN